MHQAGFHVEEQNIENLNKVQHERIQMFPLGLNHQKYFQHEDTWRIQGIDQMEEDQISGLDSETLKSQRWIKYFYTVSECLQHPLYSLKDINMLDCLWIISDMLLSHNHFTESPWEEQQNNAHTDNIRTTLEQH